MWKIVIDSYLNIFKPWWLLKVINNSISGGLNYKSIQFIRNTIRKKFSDDRDSIVEFLIFYHCNGKKGVSFSNYKVRECVRKFE